jgi:RNA polymerase sigma factor (sigma-70 family)
MARIDAEVGPGGVRVAPALRRPARRGDHRIVDTADIPEQMGVSTDRNQQLRGWIAQMSREHREVIDLVYYHEKSVEEVAEIIHMPKNTVKTRAFYARKRLAQLLSIHQDFDHLIVARAA